MQEAKEKAKAAALESIQKSAIKTTEAGVLSAMTTKHGRQFVRSAEYENKQGVQRQLVLDRVEYELNEDEHEILRRFQDLYHAHVKDAKAMGLPYSIIDADGIMNRIRRGVNHLTNKQNGGGMLLILPRLTVHLNEKSRDVYDLYTIFLINTLYKMGFGADHVVKATHSASNHSKFMLIASLLKWLAAKTLSQAEENGFLPLFEEFAGDALLDAGLLRHKGWLSDSTSNLYSALVSEQSMYLALIKARRKEDRLSRAAIKSINDGLDVLDQHEKTLVGFLLAEMNSVFDDFHLAPKDIDARTFQASLLRAYLQYGGSKNREVVAKCNIQKFQALIQRHDDYALSQALFDYLFSCLTDIAVLRRLLKALASLHENTGWLIVGLSSAVDVSALQAAFDCFQMRMKACDLLYISIMKRYTVSCHNPDSIGAELQKMWSKRSAKVELDFKRFCSEEVLSYVKKDIARAMRELSVAQRTLVSRGLAAKPIFHHDILGVRAGSSVTSNTEEAIVGIPAAYECVRTQAPATAQSSLLAPSCFVCMTLISIAALAFVALSLITSMTHWVVPPILLVTSITVLGLMLFSAGIFYGKEKKVKPSPFVQHEPTIFSHVSFSEAKEKSVISSFDPVIN